MSSVNIEGLVWILHLARLALYPSHYTLDHLLSLYTPTVQDKKAGGIPTFKKIIFIPAYVLLLILLLPIVIVFFPIRCLILFIRSPYLVSVKYTPYTKKYKHEETKKIRFGLASCNTCLLPEFMSRFNHLRDVRWRSRKIGERIVIDQFYEQDYDSKNIYPVCDTSDKEVPGEISTKFGNIDFFLIQETWTTYYNKPLMRELHKVFPYIIHDAGVHSFANNKFTLNSGLMIASRYPVAAVDFKPFDTFCKHGGLLSQGLLMVKVDLGGGRKQGGRRVGYLFNTHMQSYQEDEVVIPSQMDEILQYADDFVRHSRSPNDQVLFNFLCGDFNCDNMSPGDKDCQDHRLFQVYEDFCRERPGWDKDWTVGTELRQHFQFDTMMMTPKDMKAILSDPSLRRRHVLDADVMEHNLATLVHRDPPCDRHGNVLESPIGGKRRIDLITFHKAHPVKVEKYNFVTRLSYFLLSSFQKVEKYNFVTRLATLTDHIPVQMEFTCLDQS